MADDELVTMMILVALGVLIAVAVMVNAVVGLKLGRKTFIVTDVAVVALTAGPGQSASPRTQT